MNLKVVFNFLALILMGSSVYAQAPNEEVYMINMSGVLPYVLVFYVFTFISLGLFMTKLMRPNFPTYWLYISCIIAILGAGVVTWAFKEVKENQLPAIENSDLKEEDLSEPIRQQLKQRQKEDQQQEFANFWIISIPNIALLGLGIFYDWRMRGRDPNAVRGRYD
jgi:hypothetical protein